MRNKKLLFILIPVLIVVLVLIAGVVYLKLNSSPEKIFKNSIEGLFAMIESSEEQFSTMKGTMNLSASVESDNEQVQAINAMLEGISINANMGMDTANMIINEKLNVTLSNTNVLDATILLQDQKGYVYLPEWLDKYLEIPAEDMEYSDLTEYYSKLETLNQDELMETVKEEFIAAVTNQELIQENAIIVLDGKETKVVATTISLKGQALMTFANGFLFNLKSNENFQVALGDFKSDVILMIDQMLQTLEGSKNQDVEINDEIKFTIYTKGFTNKFAGFSAETIDGYYGETTGFDLLKHNDEKNEFKAYNINDGIREEAFNILVEDKKENKNKGTATITIIVNGEPLIITYTYEKQGKQTTFVASTQIEGITLSFSGSALEEGKNTKGNFVVSVQEETLGKVNLNCTYDFIYDVEIPKVNVGDAVVISELTEEDQQEFMTNFMNSDLYKMIEPIATNLANQFTLGGVTHDAVQNASNNLPQVTYDGYTVKYNVPQGFPEVSSYDSDGRKMYVDENYNSISVTINYDSVDTYMKELEDEYVLTSQFYENQKISDTKSMNINGKEYKLRTITYKDEYGSYANLYFAYELDDEYCYVVEVESEGGNISMDTIKYFLDVTVEEDNINNIVNQLEQSTDNRRQDIISGLSGLNI